MNNFTFGNADHQYYETICGGSGAGPDHDGTDAVQTHMTNSRLTDPEILETRLPVRLETLLRSAADRAGRARITAATASSARITFLEPMRANILANRRAVAPRGNLRRRRCGSPDVNWVDRADGRVEDCSLRDRRSR